MTDTTHDLALARAERDAWQTTCEELHHQIARLTVEAETYRDDIDAADQRARTLDAALAHEREAGRGLVAQVEALRAESRHHAAIAAQNATISNERDAAIARAEAAECEVRELRATVNGIAGRLGCAEDVGAVLRSFGELCVEVDDLRAKSANAEIAKLRAEVAELRARPVLTVEAAVAAAREADWSSAERHDAETVVEAILAALGPVTLPAPDRAEELWRKYHERAADMDGHMVGRWQYHGPESQAICTEAMRHALTSLGAPPTSPPAARPVFAGVSEDELIRLFYVVGTDGIDHGEQCPPIDISDRNGIRAVLARLEVSLVAPEFLRRIPLYTKHGPGGKGGPGPCDAACVKCEAERMFLGAPAREVAPTLVAVRDDDLGRAAWSKYNNADSAAWPNITIGVRAMWTAAARAVRAKLGAAEVTEERVKAALCEHFKHEGHRDWSADARAILAHLRATAAKGG